MRAIAAVAAVLFACAPASAREIYSMACEGKAAYFDTMDNNVTVTLVKDGRQTAESHPAARVEKTNGFVAVDVKTTNTTMIFRFREHPVKGEDNNEALIVLPDAGGQETQVCTR